MKRRGALKLAGAASAWLALPPAVRAASKPPPTPEQAIRNLGFAQSDVGYFLFDVQSKRVLEEQNANQLFLPASVSKLPTVYAALEILGADYRFPTTLRRRGSDIYLRGGGDPSLANTDLQALVAQLRAAPLTDVSTGSAVSRFIYDDSLMVSLPEITARQPVAVAYNTGLSALDVNFNRVEVDWQLKPNGRFDLRALCVADDMILPADWITFAPADPAVWADTPFIYAGDSTLDRWQYARTLPDHGSTFLPVKATAAHTARLFRALAKAGGVALPMPEPGQLPADAVEIGRVESRPLAEIIIGLLRFSNNPSAELVGLAASRKLTDESLTLGPSAAALTRWLKEQAPKANWEGFHLENHSGLSPDSRVTPRQMAQILTLVAEDDALMQAIPGLTGDGRATLADDPRGLIGKSGTMDYARGLAGYFLSKDGHPLGFAIFVFDPAQRALLDATMNPNVPVSTPAAIGWIRRALQVDQVLLASWMKTY